VRRDLAWELKPKSKRKDAKGRYQGKKVFPAEEAKRKNGDSLIVWELKPEKERISNSAQ